MTAKTYRAKSISDALGQVKDEFGRDAVILKTRSLRKGGFLGVLGGKRYWEIVACPASDVSSKPIRGGYIREQDIEKLPDCSENTDDDSQFISEAGQTIASKTPIITAEQENETDGQPPSPVGNNSLAQQVDQLRSLVEAVLERTDQKQSAPKGCIDVHGLKVRMVEQGVYEDIADELIGELRMSLTGGELADETLAREKLTELVAGRIQAAPFEVNSKQKAKVIALIGPTGVGKTTTVAKLAANLKLKQRLNVGLITIDTYRIAAVDQLRTYAEIIEVPLRTVLDSQQMLQAVYALRGMDVILLDTTGRSQNDLLRLKHLRSFLDSAGVDEVHLVVSATANRRCADAILRNFAPLGANRLLVTKLDEADGVGAILNLASSNVGKITYITNGQEVPDDITQADSMEIAKRITGGLKNV